MGSGLISPVHPDKTMQVKCLNEENLRELELQLSTTIRTGNNSKHLVSPVQLNLNSTLDFKKLRTLDSTVNDSDTIALTNSSSTTALNTARSYPSNDHFAAKYHSHRSCINSAIKIEVETIQGSTTYWVSPEIELYGSRSLNADNLISSDEFSEVDSQFDDRDTSLDSNVSRKPSVDGSMSFTIMETDSLSGLFYCNLCHKRFLNEEFYIKHLQYSKSHLLSILRRKSNADVSSASQSKKLVQVCS